MDRCPECGFDYYGFARTDIGDRLRSLAESHAERLSETPFAYASARPRPGWSALEYGCHVRDVLLVQRERIALAQVEDRPTFVPMRRDERAVELRYNEQEPATVATGLHTAANALANVLAGFDDSAWARSGTYTYPEPALRDVDWIARHTVHELSHHLGDVDRVLEAVLEG